MTDVIRELPVDDRPRERMLKHGIQTLSNAELFAIVIGSGMRGRNAIQLGRDLLSDGFEALMNAQPAKLAKIPGMGTAKATRVCAAIEIGRRSFNRETEELPDYEPSLLGRKLIRAYAGQTQERLGAAFLDARHRIIKQHEIYVGTVDNALVSTRDIIRHAMFDHAVALVIYHNHPSGDPVPSTADEVFTRKLKDSLALCDLVLVDHLIIGKNRYFSMKETGWLKGA